MEYRFHGRNPDQISNSICDAISLLNAYELIALILSNKQKNQSLFKIQF